MDMFFAMVIRPLVAFVLFGLALWIARLLIRLIPRGRVRDFLTRPIGVRKVKRNWD